MPRRPKLTDPVKLAFADLVFSALTHALGEVPGSALDPAHEPLEDALITTAPISDLELYCRVIVQGKTRFFSVRISEDHQAKK